MLAAEIKLEDYKMESREETARKAEALRAIYRKDGVDLANDEAVALAEHLGSRPFGYAIVCIIILIALVAFLVVRFLL